MTFRSGLIETACVDVAAGWGPSRSGAQDAGPVELEQVVGGGDQLPFGLRGGKAAAGDASDRAGVFGLPELGLDGGGAQSHHALAGVGIQALLHGGDEVVGLRLAGSAVLTRSPAASVSGHGDEQLGRVEIEPLTLAARQ